MNEDLSQDPLTDTEFIDDKSMSTEEKIGEACEAIQGLREIKKIIKRLIDENKVTHLQD